MNSSSEEFVKLRQEILDQALPLLDSDTIAADDRFRLSLQIAQTKGSIDSYRKAFQIAEGMEGDDKLTAYLDLLGDIDYMIEDRQAVENPGPTEQLQEESTQSESGNNIAQQ